MRIFPLQIYQAKKRIAPWVTRTPLVRAHDLSELCGAEIWSKLEILQPTGAFKLRGATNTILQLNEDERKQWSGGFFHWKSWTCSRLCSTLTEPSGSNLFVKTCSGK